MADDPDFNDAPVITGPGGTLVYENASTSGSGVNSINQTDTRSSPAITPDGKFVVFYSDANNLVAGDTNGVRDVFVKNLLDGSIERVSVGDDEQQSNGSSGAGVLSISANGRYVLFSSAATNLVASDTNGETDIFLRDTVLGTTTRVSVGPAGEQASAASSLAYGISDDGKFALFESDAAFVAADTNGTTDLYVKNLVTGEVTLASVNAAGDLGLAEDFGGSGTRPAFFSFADMSDDGRYVAFETDAQNMVPGYDNGTRPSTSRDVYLKDMQTGEVFFVSERNAGGASQNDSALFGGGAREPKVSADGRYVVFSSNMTDLVTGGTDGGVFLWDRDAAPGSKLRLISTNANGTAANGFAEQPNISPNGRYVVFESDATNLVSETVPSGPNGSSSTTTNVFVKDVLTGEVRFVGTTTGGESDRPSVTDDGRVIAFSAENDFAPGDSDGEVDVYVARFSGSGSIPVLEDTLTTIKSISFSDVDAGAGEVTVTFSVTLGELSVGIFNNNWVLSPDGLSLTVTDSIQEINDAIQAGVLRYRPPSDYTGGVPLTVTIDDNGNTGPDPSDPPDGSESATRTFTIDIVPVNDAPVIIGPSTTTSYYNVSTTSAGVNGSQQLDFSSDAKLSADGVYAAFSTDGSDLFPGDTNAHEDVFRKNLQTGALEVVSVGLGGALANGDSTFISMSADGRFMLFESDASNLVADDTNGVTDVFVRDMLTGVTTRIVKSDGQQSFATFADRISDDGRYVLLSTIGAFVPEDTDNAFSSYLFDRQTGTFRLNGDAGGQDMSADGRYIVYQRVDDVANGPNRQSFSNDIYLYDAVTGTTELVSTAFGGGYPQDGFHGSYRPHITADGRYVVYASDSGDILQPGVTAHSDYIFLWDRLTKTNTLIATNVNGDPADASSDHPYITRNGEFLVFKSAATNLVSPSAPPATISQENFFLKNLSTGQVFYVGSGNGNAYPWVSEDGRVALFTSNLALASGDNDGVDDLYAAFLSVSGGSIPVTEDVASPIRGISFTDVDAGNGNVTVTFTVPRGTLSATSAGSVTVSGGPASITLVGTIANINTFLAQDRLLYTTVLNDTADVSLAVAIDDGGNSGLDPGLTGTATSEADAETFTITVIAVNDAPVAQDGTASGNEDTPISGTLTATDVDSASLTYALVTNAAHGTVTVHADGTFIYVPAADYNGSDSFTFKANDGEADSNVATIGLTINPVDDPIAGPRTDPGTPPRLFDLAGVGTPGPHGGTWATPGVSDGFFVVATGDFNGDGTDDVLWRDASGRIDEWSMQNESWATSIYLGARGTDWQVAGTGDFNGDGTSDVLWRNTTTGQLDTWIMQNGQWSKSIGLGTHGTDWKVLGTGDFNGDGTDDILFQNTKTGAVDGWQMANGNWSKSLAIGGARDLAYSQVAIGDFDGDGTSDVLWRNPTTGAVDEWHIKDGNWAGSIDLGTFNTGYELAGVDDFNGNGTADILWRNPTTGQVDGWVMHNGQWFASVSLGSFDPAYRLGGTGDFNHSGADDVFWYNPNTGNTNTWLLQAV